MLPGPAPFSSRKSVSVKTSSTMKLNSAINHDTKPIMKCIESSLWSIFVGESH